MKKVPIYMFLISCFIACKENYLPPEIDTNLNYLVVDGFLNNNTGDTTFIRLTRTRKLDSSLANAGERNAAMSVEDEEGNTLYYFSELNNGIYAVPGMSLSANRKYRLRIKTANGKEYLSDEIIPTYTPPIDSINWAKTRDGVTIYSNAHNTAGTTKYYRWDYTETYEYHASLLSQLKYDSTRPGQGIILPRSQLMYICWKTNTSSELLLASSEKLAEDVIYRNPIRFIAQNSIELDRKYSILVRQYSLPRAAYEYLQNLRKNTEQTGSIFDAQPSELNGNIHTVNNPEETVLGYVTACNVDSTRIYISNSEVAPWVAVPLCSQVLVSPDSTDFYFNPANSGLIPVSYYDSQPNGSIWGAVLECTDCRLHGGTLQKPDFWP